MAGRNAAGLTIGQLITLTFGFLLASVVIFVFGLWIGRDLAEQRLARENQIVRLPVSSPTPLATVAAPAEGTPAAGAIAATPTSSSIRIVIAPTATSPASAWGIPPTQEQQKAERFAPPTPPAPATGATTERGWTVQANATTDPVQAVVLARRLRAKGYDAYTAQGPIGGVTWYRVRVGRFRDRDSAKQIETQLRKEEGLEAAYVAPE